MTVPAEQQTMPRRTVVLGIAGDSAAGKTTLAHGLAALLGDEQVNVICTDDYHRYNRLTRRRLGVSALHPDGNDIELLEHDLARLAAGETIHKPVYNHLSGDFDQPQAVGPRPFLLIEGLLAFATPQLREHSQLKVYLDTPEELRREWKLRRDMAERGYSHEQSLADLAARERDSHEFIRPQRHWADAVVRLVPQPHLSAAPGLQLILRAGLPPLDLSSLVAQANTEQPTLHQRVGRFDGRLTEILEVGGRVAPAEVARFADAAAAQLPSHPGFDLNRAGALIGANTGRRSATLALTQLLLSCYLLVASHQLSRAA
jgi:phosphoribulokinase